MFFYFVQSNKNLDFFRHKVGVFCFLITVGQNGTCVATFSGKNLLPEVTISQQTETFHKLLPPLDTRCRSTIFHCGKVRSGDWPLEYIIDE